MRLHWIGLLAVTVACGEPEVVSSEPLGDAPAAAAAPAAPPHAAASPHDKAAGGQEMSVLQGVVREVAQGGSSTYVRIDTCGTESWVMGPTTELAEGQTLAVLASGTRSGVAIEGTGRTLDEVTVAARLGISTVPVDCSAAASQGVAEQLPPPGGLKEGKVVESFESGGYLYARVDYCGTEGWIAGPPTAVAVGDTIGLAGGMTMTDFHSSTLDRTFPKIDFVGAISKLDREPRC